MTIRTIDSLTTQTRFRTCSPFRRFKTGPNRGAQRSTCWVFACRWTMHRSWARSRSSWFPCGCCWSPDAKITRSAPSYATRTRQAATVRPLLPAAASLPDIEPRQLYSNGQRWLIFHSIFANNLFVTFDRWSRIDSLRNPNALVHDDPTGIKRRLDRLSMSFARNFFFWFPVMASSLVFALDRMSYFLEDPFAPELRPPGWEAPWFFASALVFVVCWVPLVICCRGAARYSRATGNVLREYGERLRADLLRRDSRRTQDMGA